MDTIRAATAKDYGMRRRTASNRALLGMKMAETRALGVITGIAARMDRREIYVFDDRLVLVSSGLGAMYGKVLAMQFGLIGMLIYRLGRKSRVAAAEHRRQLSADELLALDPKNIQIMARDIVDARLSSGLLTGKLTLSLADGTNPQFSWARSDNQYEQVLGFLRGALGTKLVDEKKAA
jgi:hypothetical protein